MNERIKKLVKQAGGHIFMRNLASNPVQYIESIVLWDDRIEKFAELIVRECARRSYLEDSGNPEVEEALKFWRKDMLKHFGVEE